MARFSEDLDRLEDKVLVSSNLKETMVLRTRMLKISPDNSFIYSKWAIQLLKQRQYRKAKQKFKRSIIISPDSVKPYDDWTTGLYLEREFEEVIMLLEKYHKKFTFPHNVQNTIGVCFLHLGDYDNAITRFRKAILMKSSSELAHFNWALALYLQGKKEEALGMYERAVQICRFPEWAYKREVEMLKKDLEREENKKFEDLIKAKMEGFEFLMTTSRTKMRENEDTE